MRQSLASILFEDEDKEAAEMLRESVIDPARKSAKAERKAFRRHTDDRLPVHSFQTLWKDLSTVCLNWVNPNIKDAECFTQITELSPTQRNAFQLLDVSL